MKKQKLGRWNLPTVLALIVLCLFAVICVAPFLYMLIMSFTQSTTLIIHWEDVNFTDFSNFIYVFTKSNFVRALISICIVAIWKNVGYFLVIYYAGIMGISRDLYESSAVDGATGRQQFFMITLPMLKPITYLVVTLGIIWSFQVFDLSYLMTGGGPGKASVTLVMSIYNSAFKQYRMGYACAQAVFLLAVVVVINVLEDKVFNREGGSVQ